MKTQEEITNWYDQWHRTHGINSWRPIESYKLFLPFFGNLPARVLDVGCGVGSLLSLLHNRGYQTYGVDISIEAIGVAHAVSPYSTLISCSGVCLPYKDQYFDYVSVIGSLEHFINMEKGLHEIHRVLKRGGRAIILVPNRWWIPYWLGRPGTAQAEINEHLLSLSEWRRTLTHEGLFHLIGIKQDPYHRYPIPLQWSYQFLFVLERV